MHYDTQCVTDAIPRGRNVPGHPAMSWTPDPMSDADQEPLCALGYAQPPGWRVRYPQVPRPYTGLGPAYPDASACGLLPRPESVKIARDFAKRTLCGWDMVELLDDLGLVVSELVTNALRHAVAPYEDDRRVPPIPGSSDHRRPIQLSLQRNGSHVVCAVTDPSSDIPVRREPDHIAETGRGLHLVECFSRAWGWTPVTGHGKIVWALFCPPR